MSTDTPAEQPAAETEKGLLAFLSRHAEITIVTLLGVVSVATAYVSFEAALYDGQTAKALSESQSATAEAESLYLEGNQQYVQDGQTIARLTELQVQMASEDEATAQLASDTYDAVRFVAVSEQLDAAIDRAAALTEADPEFYYSPLDDEEYQAFLFGSYAEKNEQAQALAKDADDFDARGDKLTLSTVLMAISLFLLGVAAVVGRAKTQFGLVVIGTVVFLGAAGFAATIPFIWV